MALAMSPVYFAVRRVFAHAAFDSQELPGNHLTLPLITWSPFRRGSMYRLCDAADRCVIGAKELKRDAAAQQKIKLICGQPLELLTRKVGGSLLGGHNLKRLVISSGMK
jgi:hypothetical protein